MNLHWFSEFGAKGFAFVAGNLYATVKLGIVSLLHPAWAQEVLHWVITDAIPSVIDFGHATAEVLLHLYSS